jgi:hypothetical protein
MYYASIIGVYGIKTGIKYNGLTGVSPLHSPLVDTKIIITDRFK